VKAFPSSEADRERTSQYDYRHMANVPSTSPKRSCPQTSASTRRSVGPGDEPDEAAEPGTDDGSPTSPRTGKFQAGQANPSLPARLPAGRDGLRAACLAMVTRHFGAASASPHPERRRDERRRDESSRDHTRCPVARTGVQVGQSLEEPARRAALPPSCTGGEPLGRPLRRRPRRVRIADPARGIRRMRRSEFADKWSGYAALFARTPELDTAPVEPSRMRWS